MRNDATPKPIYVGFTYAHKVISNLLILGCLRQRTMESVVFLLFFGISCHNLIMAQQNLPNSRLIFDLTKPVNDLIDRKYSDKEFISYINSAFGLIGGNVTNSTLFYAIDGGTIEEMESQSITACEIINQTLTRDPDSQLLISWGINFGTLHGIWRRSNNNRRLKDCSPSILLNLYNISSCEGAFLPVIKHIYRGLYFGAGLDESLLVGCSGFTSSALSLAKMLVVNMEFGSTEGVTESFGLFETRLKDAYGKVLDATFEDHDAEQQILYFPKPNSVGNDQHRNLLIRYASVWAASNQTVGSMVLQIPTFPSSTLITNQFTIIPHLIKSIGQFEYPEGIPGSLVLFTSGFKRQQSMIMTKDAWHVWQNSQPISVNKTHQNPKTDLPIDVILDCEYCYCRDSDSFNIHILDDGNTYQPGHLIKSKPSTVLYNVDTVVELRECPTFPGRPTQPLFVKVNVGCVFKPETFQTMNESNVTAVVSVCQRINGTLYILQTTVTLEWYKEIGQYSFFFENTVRKELHAVNQFRKGILKRDPLAKVYFQVNTRETGHPSLHDPLGQSNSLFCEKLKPSVNLYFEGIYNWAKMEGFPIIYPMSFNYPFDFFGPWMSLMRRLNYPYSDWSDEDSKVNPFNTGTSNNPAFLMQDYLKSTLNWKLDTCIDWTEKRTEIQDDFFHNNKIGSVFHFVGIPKNRTIKKDDFVPMLQFIFYRFRLVEFGVNMEFSNFLAAIGNSLASQYLSFDTEIFMNYEMPAKNNLSDFLVYESFLKQLKVTTMYERALLKGLHTKLLVDSQMPYKEGIFSSSNIEIVSRMVDLAKVSNFSIGIELPSVETCTEMIEHCILDSSSEYSELIGTLNYIVCNETRKFPSRRSRRSQRESLLDTHLLTKRILHQSIPHVQIYFRVELDFEIGQSTATMDRYTNVLNLFKTFGNVYDINYFIVNAFDNQLKNHKNGWWRISNYSDLGNPKSYVEKVTDLRGQRMWYPPTAPSILMSIRHDSSLAVIVSSVSFGVLLVLLAIGICFGLRYRKLRKLNRFLSKAEVQEFLNGRVSTAKEPASLEMESMGGVDHMKFNQDHQLNLLDLTIDIEKVLGSGTFGTVYNGLVKDNVAAIKRPNRDCSRNTFKSFLTEVKILSYIGNHPNVVGFLGAYVNEIHKNVLYVATELCLGGSLETFLRKKANATSQATSNQESQTELDASVVDCHDLNTFAMEIAKGMEYIESKRVVHGDLSTRNVLLDENLVCKIGDFGLSRKLYEYQKYVKTSQEPLPWKWMAYESLDKMEFTSKSDVWSYGVTLWEIYSLGKIPYGGLNWSVGFANELKNGLRLPTPDFASPEIFTKMLECWNLNPDERPCFTDIIKFFVGLSDDSYMIIVLAENQSVSTNI